MLDFIEIYNSLDFLSESIKLQYSNFIIRHKDKLQELDFGEILDRIKKNEPIEYIFNIAEFYGNNFYVDNRCLIPRPETEEIVKRTLEFISANDHSKYAIIDVGTGSGCIILSITRQLAILQSGKAQDMSFPRKWESSKSLTTGYRIESGRTTLEQLRLRTSPERSKESPTNISLTNSPERSEGSLPNVSKLGIKLIGLDISPDALEVAKINRKNLDLENNVDFINADFRDFDFSQYENLIICVNLPYIPNNEELQKSVIDYEPHLALFGGEKGNELNDLLLERLKPLKNIKAIFMEGYNGEIYQF